MFVLVYVVNDCLSFDEFIFLWKYFEKVWVFDYLFLVFVGNKKDFGNDREVL